MAYFEKRGEHSYRLVVESGYYADGRRRRFTKTIKYEKKPRNSDLEKELAKFITEIEAGTYIAPERMTFESFVAHWRSKFVEQDLQEKTRENYLTHMRNRILPYFGHMRMDQIKSMHIMDFLLFIQNDDRRDQKKGPLSSSTFVYNYRVLRSVFTKAVEWKIIKENPMDGVKKPKETRKKIDVWDETEIAEVFEALEKENQQFRLMVILALTTGLRRGEIIGLEWKHINFDKGTLEVKQSIPIWKDGKPLIKAPKTESSERIISIPESVISELRAYYDDWKKNYWKVVEHESWIGEEHQFIFCSWNGQALSQHRPTKWWTSFFVRNPHIRKIRFHDLRHTSATLLINQGVHAKIIQSRLGHKKISTTMDVYGHVLQSADQVAASKFDHILPLNRKKDNA